jgi:hypothetical protein
LIFLDVSDPAKPVLLGSYTTTEEIRCLFVEGNRVYLSDSVDGLHIVDATDPARPTPLSVGKPEDCYQVSALCLSDSRLYCAMYNYWAAVDVSDPAAPRIVGEMDSVTGLPLHGICARDNLVFVAEGNFGYRNEPDYGGLSIFGSDASGNSSSRENSNCRLSR